MGDGARAELIADGGRAAASDDFFRSPAFLAAEGVTHSLAIAGPGRAAVMPVIVREIAGEAMRDAISPYGYPGATVKDDSGEPPPAAEVDWAPAGIVSLFARERLTGPRWLAGGRDRGSVQVHDPSRPRGVRPRLGEQIRSNRRRGYSVAVAAGPEATAGDVHDFHALYTQTMERTGASARYFFTPEYLAAVLAFERSWLLTARDSDGGPAAGAIAAVSDGLLHYFLGGTAESHLADSPFKNVVEAMLDLADELAMPLNLGGGLSPGDGLETFKRGFANATLPFVTHEVVCDAAAYERLSAGREIGGDYFPLYRAPA